MTTMSPSRGSTLVFQPKREDATSTRAWSRTRKAMAHVPRCTTGTSYPFCDNPTPIDRGFRALGNTYCAMVRPGTGEVIELAVRQENDHQVVAVLYALLGATPSMGGLGARIAPEHEVLRTIEDVVNVSLLAMQRGVRLCED